MKSKYRYNSFDKKNYLYWLDHIKGIALLWIFLVHFVENFIPGSYFGNPTSGWPILAERFNQLKPYEGSGFGLTWAALSRNKPLKIRSYISRRIGKIYPDMDSFTYIISYYFCIDRFRT